MYNHNLYQKKLRRSLIISSILPVFLIIVIGMLGYYAVYIIRTNYELNSINRQLAQKLKYDQNYFKKSFQEMKTEALTDETTIYRSLYNMSNVNKTSYVFRFNYKKIYTNEVTQQQHIPLYQKSGKIDGEPYEFTMLLPKQIIEKYLKNTDYEYVVTDKFDNIYESSALYKEGYKQQLNDPKRLMSYQKLGNIKLILYQDLTETIDNSIILVTILSVTFILMVLVSLYTSHLLSERQTKDINEIIGNIRRAQVRALHTYTPLSQASELEIINRYVYELSILNERLLKLTKETNETLRQTQIQSLEHQFQPHFIFNTMQIINYMIDMDQIAAKKMMIKLSSILRYTLRVKESEVTFRKEISYIEDYLYIQNIRFEDAISYIVNIEDSLLDIKTDKLLIQPLIENAIKYADREKVSLIISIKKLKSNDIFIAVQDNGKSMTKERLTEVRHNIKNYQLRHLHIGLQNIHQTLQVKYGNHDGMKIFSKQDIGTLIVLRAKGRV